MPWAPLDKVRFGVSLTCSINAAVELEVHSLVSLVLSAGKTTLELDTDFGWAFLIIDLRSRVDGWVPVELEPAPLCWLILHLPGPFVTHSTPARVHNVHGLSISHCSSEPPRVQHRCHEHTFNFCRRHRIHAWGTLALEAIIHRVGLNVGWWSRYSRTGFWDRRFPKIRRRGGLPIPQGTTRILLFESLIDKYCLPRQVHFRSFRSTSNVSICGWIDHRCRTNGPWFCQPNSGGKKNSL